MKKTFMLVSALAMVAMSIAITSCKKDKEPSSCTCTSRGKTYVYAGSLLEEAFNYYNVNSCSGLGRGLSMDNLEDISCK